MNSNTFTLGAPSPGTIIFDQNVVGKCVIKAQGNLLSNADVIAQGNLQANANVIVQNYTFSTDNLDNLLISKNGVDILSLST